jgi:hypothetical protein
MPAKIDNGIRVVESEAHFGKCGDVFADPCGKSGQEIVRSYEDPARFQKAGSVPKDVTRHVDRHLFQNGDGADHVEVSIREIGLALATEKSTPERAVGGFGTDFSIEPCLPFSTIAWKIMKSLPIIDTPDFTIFASPSLRAEPKDRFGSRGGLHAAISL